MKKAEQSDSARIKATATLGVQGAGADGLQGKGGASSEKGGGRVSRETGVILSIGGKGKETDSSIGAPEGVQPLLIS